MSEIYQLPDNGNNNGGFGSSSTGVDYLKKSLDENEKENKEEVYAIPLNENKAK